MKTMLIALVVVLGLSVTVYALHAHNVTLTALNAKLEAALKACTQANQINEETIHSLKSANEKYAAEVEASNRASYTAVQAALAAQAVREQTQHQIAALKARDVGNVTCERILALNVKDYCPNIAQAILQPQ